MKSDHCIAFPREDRQEALIATEKKEKEGGNLSLPGGNLRWILKSV